MKNWSILVAAVVFFLSAAPDTGAWNRVGHGSIARIAQNHLSSRTLRKVQEYLQGESMAAVATDPDTYRGAWAMDVGFVPSNADDYRYKWMTDFDFSTPKSVLPVSHAVTIRPDGTPWRTDRDGDLYINNAAVYIERWAKELHDRGDSMDPEERYRKLVFIIHLMGDIHCPGHVFFDGRNDVGGRFQVQYRGENIRYHYFWDYTVFARNGIYGISDGVAMTDTATKREIKEITKGDIWDWVSDSAATCLPAYEMVPEDRVLPDSFATQVRPILYKQIRNAGYRLAALLESIY